MADFPPSPWRLHGQLYASALLVPLDRLPFELPTGWSPVRVAGRGVVGVAWVDYDGGGVLRYRELMATVLVRRGRRVRPTIIAIWVDSEASRDGGRALWGIPKQLAHFEFGAPLRARSMNAHEGSNPIATGRVRQCLSLPGRWPVAFSIVQTLEGAPKVSPVRSRARVALTTASLDADVAGPLSFLIGRRPLVSFCLRDFTMVFGAADTRSGSREANGG